MILGSEPRDPRPDQASLERDLRRLKTDLRQLEIEYTMFFAGQHPWPPLESRVLVEAIIRRWDQVPIQGSTARFRYNTLLLRFRTFSDLWDRWLRSREEGRPGPFTNSS